MSLTQELAEHFRDSLVFEPFEGPDVEGQPTYGSSYSLSGRLVQKPQVFVQEGGRQVPSNSHAYVDEGAKIVSPQDRVTLPDGSQPPIVALARYTDASGDKVTTIFFGSTTQSLTSV